MTRALVAFLGIGCFSAALAQPPASPLAFEVASIKPSSANPNGWSIRTTPGERLNAANVAVRNLISFAWDIKDYQLSGGPSWIGSEHFDVIAKTARDDTAFGGADPKTISDAQRTADSDRIRERLRTLLADRFGLMTHQAVEEQNVYYLTVAKSATKMKATVPGVRRGMSGTGWGHTQAYAVTTGMLATYLTNTTGRLVVDKTGFTGKYDWTLDWVPDGPAATESASPPPAGPTIFTAVQEQFGLKLESGKAPVDKLVIDRISRPTEN